jgi:acetylornithine/N-succinyldiaminopimelate aminotransferase
MSMDYKELGDKYFLHTYNRYPIVIERGEGVKLYDDKGREYLDFAAGIAVYALGYGNREFNDALKRQIDLIMHTSNLYYNEPACLAAKDVCEVSGMARVFFTNSGTEAIEGAIKTARKYAYLKDGKTDHNIIAMEHSFHGRSMGALSVTGNAHYREAFEPGIGQVRFASFNDLESVKKLVDDRTCAVIMETVQGEGGIYPADEAFLKELRRICDERDILLILDEIQCGMGRSGEYFAWQRYGVKPDVMTVAKALGCGVPVGAFLMTEKVARSSLAAGDHGTTYGGNPLAGAAICSVLKLFEEKHVLENVREVGAYLFDVLEVIKAENSDIIDHRGVGLMQGLEFDHPVADIINKALDKGLVLINAGTNIIRFLPSLVISKKDVDDMAAILRECL